MKERRNESDRCRISLHFDGHEEEEGAPILLLVNNRPSYDRQSSSSTLFETPQLIKDAAGHSSSTLSGHLRITVLPSSSSSKGQLLPPPLKDIHDIKLRFTGSLVCKSARGRNGFLDFTYVGSDKIFDKTVSLLPSHGGGIDEEELSVGEHRFPFTLSLPSTKDMPASQRGERVIVEYLVIGMISFQNGCCNLIPILQPRPLSTRVEVMVEGRGITDYFREMVEEEEDYRDVKLLEEQEGNMELAACSRKFDIMILMSPLQQPLSVEDESGVMWPVIIQMSRNLKLKRVAYKVLEFGSYQYRLDQKKKVEVSEASHEEFIVDYGEITEFNEVAGEGMNYDDEGKPEGEERLTRICIPIVNQVMPDVHNRVVSVTHRLCLSVSFSNTLFQEELTESFNLPIQVTQIKISFEERRLVN